MVWFGMVLLFVSSLVWGGGCQMTIEFIHEEISMGSLFSFWSCR